MAHMSHKHHAWRRGWNKYNMGAHTIKKSEAHMRSCESICPISRTQESIIYNLHTCGAPFRLTQPTQQYTLKLDTDRVAGPFTAHTKRIEQAKEPGPLLVHRGVAPPPSPSLMRLKSGSGPSSLSEPICHLVSLEEPGQKVAVVQTPEDSGPPSGRVATYS